MKWIKNNSQWILANNNAATAQFDSSRGKTATIETSNSKAVAFLPVHNIHDIYEWYRIFGESTTTLDKQGIAMHYYFNSDRAQSIQGWFPNLYEVKATSTDETQPFIYSGQYFKVSKDFIIDINAALPNLSIDGVKLINEDRVLLKNQYASQLTTYTIQSYDSFNNAIIVLTSAIDLAKINVNNEVFIVDSDSNTYSNYISNIIVDDVSLTTIIYLRDPLTPLATLNTIGDIISGQYTELPFNSNGIYEYTNNVLTLLADMDDKDKAYNQIVYTYLGDTNQNKVYYLRRVEDTLSIHYGEYPIFSDSLDFVYSEGDPHLVKCEIDYSLDNDLYDYTQHPYNLLILDKDYADKIQNVNENGIDKYNAVSNIDMGIGFTFGNLDNLNNIIFYQTDIDGRTNAVDAWLRDVYTTTNPLPLLEFRSVPLTTTAETYKNNWFATNNTLAFTNSVSLGYSYTRIVLTYGVGEKIIPATATTARDLINIAFYRDLGDKLLEFNFEIITDFSDATKLDILVYPGLDQNVVDELNTMWETDSNTAFTHVETINTYGAQDTTYTSVATNLALLEEAINKTELKNMFQFNYSVDTGTSISTIDIEKVKQHSKYKWHNQQMVIQTEDSLAVTVDYNLLHANYATTAVTYLDQFYDLITYFNTYLSASDNIILTQDGFTATYNNVEGDASRFGIEGSNKIPGYGNKILFGPTLKTNFFRYIKPGTVFHLTPDTSTVTQYIYVDSITWDETLQLGTIVTKNYIAIPINENCLFNPLIFIDEILDYIQNSYIKKFDTVETGGTYSGKLTSYKASTAEYAYALCNPIYNTISTTNTIEQKQLLTGIIFNDYHEKRISLFKRDRFFNFDNILEEVRVASVADVTITSAPANIDGYALSNGDLILLKSQTDTTENGIYIFDGAGNELIQAFDYRANLYYNVLSGTVHAGDTFTVTYNGTEFIIVSGVTYFSKKDVRLKIKPIEIAKLGVDNDIQPWQKISYKYDAVETEANLVNIQSGINSGARIRFIDGLTEFNISNDVNGQGEYDWILDENVIVTDAVVGCTQEFGPGTGTLIWYTGTWESGTWEDGIWIQGTWIQGTWLAGTMNSYSIQDYWTYVTYSTSTTSSAFTTVTTIDFQSGTFNNGTVGIGTFTNTTINGGEITSGDFTNCTSNDCTVESFVWHSGYFYGGVLRKGIWHDGYFSQQDLAVTTSIGAGSSTLNSSTVTIWYGGTFDGGEFHAGNDTNHSCAIWYGGEFRSGDWYGGSFIAGIFKNATWHDGVWYGGYYGTIANGTGIQKIMTIVPDQYDANLGVGAVNNTAHRLTLYGEDQFYLLADPTASTTFSQVAFINEWDTVNTSNYVPKDLVSTTDTTITLDITAVTAATTTYTTLNPGLDQEDGRPFICAMWDGGVFKGGIWLNGFFKDGIFEAGHWNRGWFNDGVFGINQD